MNASSVILISIFTSALTSVGALYLGHRLLPLEKPQIEVKQVVVPSVVGLAEADARANLRAAGLVLMVAARQEAEDAEPDSIISQDLPAGSKVDEHQPVGVTLAKALPLVPPVEGKAVPEATQQLEEAGYVVRVQQAVASKAVPSGAVVSQLPAAGQALPTKRTVTLVPSEGPSAVDVPKLTGLTLGSAKLNLKKAGFKLGRVSWVELAERTGYLVVNQDPKPASKAEPGASIHLVVNRGD